MATKRAASDFPSSIVPAQKRIRTPPLIHGEAIEHSVEGANTTLKSIRTELELAFLQTTITSPSQQMEEEKLKLKASAVTIAGLQAEVAKHERIEREYDLHYKWEEKLKAQKAEYDRKVQDLRESHTSKQDLKDQQCKAKVEQLKTKHDHALVTNEQSWTLKNDTIKEKASRTLAEKEHAHK